jgi:hypothetical protein
MNNFDDVRLALLPIADTLVERLLDLDLGIREGIVMTPGEPPYRRLDCDGRALCYIRVRPKKRGVRVDVSGLWNLRTPIDQMIPGSTGMASLLLRGPGDIAPVVDYLREVVRYTRAQYAAEALRRAGLGAA